MAEVTGNTNVVENRTIFLNEIIEDTSVKPLIESIIRWNHEDDQRAKKEIDFERQPIKLIVNSRGGSVRDGFALVNAIITSKTPIHTYAIGVSSSMALLVVIVGHKRFGYKLSSWMYHQIASGPMGKLKEIEESVEELKVLQKMYDDEILARTAITQEHLDLVKEQKKDWHFHYADAVKLRVVDEIL